MKEKVLIASFFAILMLTVPLSSTIVAENQTSGELQELEEQYLVVQQSNNLIPLTGDEIGYLQDFIDGIGDEPTRLLAQAIVDRFITEDGELDVDELEQVINEYGTTGLFGGLIDAIIKWIINKIREDIRNQILQKMSWWFLESLDHDRIGWLTVPITYVYNVTVLLEEIYSIFTGWNDSLNIIGEFGELIKIFLSGISEENWGPILILLPIVLIAALDLILNFPENLRLVMENVLELCNQTIAFCEWLDSADKPYEQPITIKGKLVGVDPKDIEFNCDRVEPYFPDDNGYVVMKFNTTNKERESTTWHSVCITVINTTSGDRSHIYHTAFSMGVINITFDFTGKPIKPVGPTEVDRFTIQTYDTYAIDAEGWDLEYQWSWNGNIGEWSSSSHSSGYTISRPKFWIDLGECEVKVRSRNINNRNEESEWSEPLTVTVYRRFLQGTSSSQPLQYLITQYYASIPASQPTSQPSSSQSTTTQQSTTSV